MVYKSIYLKAILIAVVIMCVLITAITYKHQPNKLNLNGEESGKTHRIDNMLTKSEIIEIATREVRGIKDFNQLTIYYDENNELWSKEFPGTTSELAGRDFQAIQFYRKSFFVSPGGVIWICVDKETGEVLVRYGH